MIWADQNLKKGLIRNIDILGISNSITICAVTTPKYTLLSFYKWELCVRKSLTRTVNYMVRSYEFPFPWPLKAYDLFGRTALARFRTMTVRINSKLWEIGKGTIKMSPLFEKYIGISILVYRLCSELTMDTMTSRVKSGRLTSSYAYKSQIRLQCCIALYFR